MGENQPLLNALVSMSPSSRSYPARLKVSQIDRQVPRPNGVAGSFDQPIVPYCSPFETDFWVASTLFSASDMSFLA